ncbi:MAG TPA: 5'-3' exonuclease H3TH domain-containing protein, partial [Candidatus Megaira endosymbiont of Hartmannula sinica]|nr:5'-3' exonuclease H3TH domain-containing protein [Candidatus Megaera endosymbiont of Hartmannula sinica]
MTNNNIDSNNDRTVIIDGYSFIFRAYYIHKLSTPSGKPIGAIYGFISMLLKLINDLNIKKAVIVLDSGSKNFRHDIYDQYKANRKPAEEDLISQLKILPDICNKIGFTTIAKKGFEADDVIATLSCFYSKEGKKSVIVSSDKDLMQLINKNSLMYDPSKRKYVSQKDIHDKFGVSADKVHDVQSLMGDSSDNITGVKGIGPKTAAGLINEFSTLHNLYENIDNVKNKRQKKLLEDHKNDALISYELTRLVKNVDILKNDITISNYAQNLHSHDEHAHSKSKYFFPVKKPTNLVISQIIYDYGFTSLKKRFEAVYGLSLSDQTDLIARDTARKIISSVNNDVDPLEVNSVINKESFARLLFSTIYQRKDKIASNPISFQLYRNAHNINVNNIKNQIDTNAIISFYDISLEIINYKKSKDKEVKSKIDNIYLSDIYNIITENNISLDDCFLLHPQGEN